MTIDYLKESEENEVCLIREKYAKMRANIEKQESCIHNYVDNSEVFESHYTYRCTLCEHIKYG